MCAAHRQARVVTRGIVAEHGRRRGAAPDTIGVMCRGRAPARPGVMCAAGAGVDGARLGVARSRRDVRGPAPGPVSEIHSREGSGDAEEGAARQFRTRVARERQS